MDSGLSLRVDLEAGEHLSLRSNGNSYQFTSSHSTFVDSGVAESGDFSGFGTSVLALTDLPQYSRIEIRDTGAGASFEFSDQNTGGFQHEIDILFDDSSNSRSVSLNGSLSFGNNSLLVTSDGAISVSAGTVVETVNGNITLTAVNRSDGSVAKRGIEVTGASLITSGTGNIGLHGQAVTTAPQLANLDGVAITENTVIQSTSLSDNAGQILITGSSGGGLDFETGVWIADSTVTSVQGDIRIEGLGSNGSGTNHFGVRTRGATISSTGQAASAATITILGLGGATTDFGIGVGLFQNTHITTVDGDVALQGIGGTGTGNSNGGLRLNGFQIASSGVGEHAGAIRLLGTGGGGVSWNGGIVARGSDSQITTVDGGVEIVGQAGEATSGISNEGIYLDVPINSTGTGPIALNGTASGGTSWNRGLLLRNSATVSSHSGGVSLTGLGGAGSGDQNEGIVIDTQAEVSSVTGDIQLHGISGTNNSHGVELFGNADGGGRVFAEEGDIRIIAEGMGSGVKDDFKLYDRAKIEGGLATVDIHIEADTVDLASTSMISSPGTLVIQPRSSGASTQRITLGAADYESRTDLNLTEAELNTIGSDFYSVSFGEEGLANDQTVVYVHSLNLPMPVSVSSGRTEWVSDVKLDSPTTIFRGSIAPGRSFEQITSNVSLASGAALFNFPGVQPGDPQTGHDRIRTSGSVEIDASVELIPTWLPSWRPDGGESLTIIERSGGTGTFAGLAEGATVPAFFNATISYAGGDGDDIVLTLPQNVEIPNAAVLGDLASDGLVVWGADADGAAGKAVNAAGDVNGDGYHDFLVGASTAQGPGNSPEDSGLVYLIFGRPDLPEEIDLVDIADYGVVFVGDGAFDVTGHHVDFADFNQDGYDDVLIGAFQRKSPSETSRTGGAYIVWGGPDLPGAIDLGALDGLGVTIFGNDSDDLAGNPVATVGDLNNDGYPDFGLGAIYGDGPDNDASRTGEAYVIYGGESLPSVIDLSQATTGFTRIYGVDQDDEAGVAVAQLGDVNGDNIDDLLIGARFADGANNATERSGENYIIYGSSDIPSELHLDTDADVTIYGIDDFDISGWLSDGGGDVNNDGFNDILIGAMAADSVGNNRENAGEVYLIWGGASLPSEIHAGNLGGHGVTIFGADAWDRLGRSVDIIEDVNADGIDDIVLGASESSGLDNANTAAGEVYILLGKETWPDQIDLQEAGAADFTLYGTDPGDQAGIMVRSAGDLNHDGINDLIVGARYSDSWNDSRLNAGEAIVVYGHSLFEPEKPVVVAPTGTSRNQRPTIEWYASTDADSYELWLEHLGAVSNPVVNSTVQGTSFTLTEDLDIGRYRAWVRSNKSNGSRSAWAALDFQVTVPTTIDPLPPYAGDRTPTISWSDVPGATAYRVFIKNTTTLETVLDDYVPSNSVDIATDLSFGRHRIWVQPVGAGGFAAEWSSHIDYHVLPDLIGPLAPTLNPRPTFSWSNLAGVASVELWVQRGSTVVIHELNLTGNSFSPPDDLQYGHYRWWIRPSADNGRSAGWSRMGEFNVGGRTTITAPAAPVSNGLAEIEWLAVNDATSYEIFLANSHGRIIHNVSGLTNTQFSTQPLHDGTYTAWVRSYREEKAGTWSQPFEFMVNSVAGLSATPRNEFETTFDTTPTLRWSATGEAASFNLYASDGNTVIVEKEISAQEWTPSVPLAAGLWHWYVQAVNESQQAGEWSDPATLDTSGRAVVLAPTGVSSAVSPVFEWSSVGDAVEYILFVEHLDTSTTVLNEGGLTTTTYTPDFAFERGNFRVWVRAVSGTGVSPWSLQLEFQLE